MKYDGILWDWNGTLLDDADYCIASVNVSLAKRGMPLLTRERYHEIFRFPIIEYYKDLGFDFTVDPYDELAEEYTATYVRNNDKLPLRPEAKEVLAVFKSKGLPQYIYTASGRRELTTALAYYDAEKYFDALVCADDCLAEGKISYGRRFIRTLPPSSRILLVGDTPHDFEAAQALGTDCVLIEGGHSPRGKLEPFGVPVLSSLTELYPIVFDEGKRGVYRPAPPVEAAERRSFDVNEAEPKNFSTRYKDFYDDLKNTNKTEDW